MLENSGFLHSIWSDCSFDSDISTTKLSYFHEFQSEWREFSADEIVNGFELKNGWNVKGNFEIL